MENDLPTGSNADSAANPPRNSISNLVSTIETVIEISNSQSNSSQQPNDITSSTPPTETLATTSTASNSTINNEPSTFTLHTPPPEYDGAPLPTGTSLLAAIRMNFDTAPTYFDVTRPSRLEDRVSNLTYTSRMAGLNAALATREMQLSIRIMYYYGRVALGFALVALVGCAALFLIFRQPAVFVVVVAVVFVVSLAPGSAKYTRKCDEAAESWSKEDEARGINLHYKTHTRRMPGQFSSRLIVTILIFEKIDLFNEDGTRIDDALPDYGELIEMQPQV
ncbi:hypothetical protein HK100_010560 [Physocladia obscura]|uniref:Uncharacterized protein n=1 Tax=Physocladia obscura TaxID=109957 RepID=A0AAD5XIT1_9FUNG|nr:hypothetical protein HK100_010560 [Physocladia obscura]